MDNAKLQQKRELYSFSGFRLDTAERRLWFEDEPISLKPKQFDLLFFFVQNAGRAITKNELLEAVWADAFVEETTLARNVSWLRTTLGKYTDGDAIIETVPKLGYRFTPEVTLNEPTDEILIVEKQTVQYVRGEEIITYAETDLVKTSEAKPAKFVSVPVIFVCLVALILIIGGGFTFYRSQTRQQPAAVTLNQATQLNVKATVTVKNITVDATREFVEAGIKVQPGDVIRVSAMGVFQPEEGQTWTLQGEENGEVAPEQTFQKADPWSLVAWIGTETDKNEYFQASTNPAYQSQKSGSLFLAVNDLVNRYADNRGGLNVAVVLYRQYEIYAENDDVEMAWGKELVNIQKDDTLEIRSRGNVSYWQNGELYDLDGSDHSTIGHLAPELNARSFIAKIGGNPPFKAGKNFPPQKTNADGWLYLSVNDRILNRANSFKNNSGEITTDVEVSRQPKKLTHPI